MKSKKASALIRFVFYLRTKLTFCLHIMTTEETLRYILSNRCSVARYGDGEIGLMLNNKAIRFQQNDEDLAKALEGVLTERPSELLICIPRYFKTLSGTKNSVRSYWRKWQSDPSNQFLFVKHLIQHQYANYIFGDALATRPYIDYKSSKNASVAYPLFKAIWSNKHVLLIEGEHSRLGVGNDLFTTCKSIRRLLCPSENAFSCYQQILEKALSINDVDLVLLALGPTATVLAKDLCAAGLQAIDIGHLDLEYEWYSVGAHNKYAVPGKYTNEVANGNHVIECDDETYLSQIICIIKE